MDPLSLSAPVLGQVLDFTKVETKDDLPKAALKVTGGLILKVAVAAFAALEFVARLAVLVLASPLYFIHNKTFTDLSRATKSAFKTIIDASAALATIRAKDVSPTPADPKTYSECLGDAFATVKKHPKIAIATVVVVAGAIALLYYNYPFSPSGILENDTDSLIDEIEEQEINIPDITEEVVPVEVDPDLNTDLPIGEILQPDARAQRWSILPALSSILKPLGWLVKTRPWTYKPTDQGALLIEAFTGKESIWWLPAPIAGTIASIVETGVFISCIYAVVRVAMPILNPDQPSNFWSEKEINTILTYADKDGVTDKDAEIWWNSNNSKRRIYRLDIYRLRNGSRWGTSVPVNAKRRVHTFREQLASGKGFLAKQQKGNITEDN